MFNLEYLNSLSYEIRMEDQINLEKDMVLYRNWKANTCISKIHNKGNNSVKLKEVVLFKGNLTLPGDTPIYGEGYSKLSQYGGTIDSPKDIGGLSDRFHYKLPQTKGFFTVYNLLMFFPEKKNIILMAFSSCRKFSGEFRFGGGSFEIVLNLENLIINPGQSIELENFFISEGADREQLLRDLSMVIHKSHPMLHTEEVPKGWCSWYCYGPDVTEEDIFENMKVISDKVPELKYIQIDDGYQAHMGDWLISGNSFRSGIKKLCLKIKDYGYEPGIWVAPFIAESESVLFKDHPDWFIKDEEGKPLPSNKVTFGGWRCGPWYMLDGTHPEAQQYLRDIFRTMREEWKCKYFKLDANMWGAMPFGKRFDSNATSIEAYRLGMKAILEGAGEDSFILGCNAPMWPSLGTVHGMRVTGDTSRNWEAISGVARECFWRNWQHGRLWINDPDCIVQEGIDRKLVMADGTIETTSETITEDEYLFQATYIFASGGMILSGDKVSGISQKKLQMLRKLISSVNTAAIFDDISFSVGRTFIEGKTVVSVFNWENEEKDIELTVPLSCKIKDFWTGERLEAEISECRLLLKGMKQHSAKLLEIEHQINP